MKTKIKYTLIQNGEVAVESDFNGILSKCIDDSYKLVYTNENKETVTLKINVNEKTVSVGTNNSIMYFEKDTTSEVDYRTDFGIIKLGLDVQGVEIINSFKCITINIIYDLIQGSERLENNLNMVINIK